MTTTQTKTTNFEKLAKAHPKIAQKKLNCVDALKAHLDAIGVPWPKNTGFLAHNVGMALAGEVTATIKANGGMVEPSAFAKGSTITDLVTQNGVYVVAMCDSSHCMVLAKSGSKWHLMDQYNETLADKVESLNNTDDTIDGCFLACVKRTWVYNARDAQIKKKVRTDSEIFLVASE